MDMLARTREILGQLVAFPTVSSDSNLELITYAADLLSDAGATMFFSRDESGTKANLFATLGPARDGGDRAVGPHGRGACRPVGVGRATPSC
jgi:acetylornithine deacetylase